MLPASMFDLSSLLNTVLPAFQDGIFHPPDWGSVYPQMLLRWLHFIAGIAWIGHLYFFNLANVKFMASLDGATKGKVIPQLMPRTLWWFRWGALVTVIVGLAYFAMYMVADDATRAKKSPWPILLIWLLIVIIAFAIEFFLLRSINNGWVLAVAVTILVAVMAIAILYALGSSLGEHGKSPTYAIGIGGGLGLLMLLNVWGVIWPNQKRIISWTADNAESGTAVPAESAKLARVAFLASRTNTWLSIPMLFFMAASTHLPGLFGLSGK